jgi:hypothetical protein
LAENVRPKAADVLGEIRKVTFPIFLIFFVKMLRQNMIDDVVHPFGCGHRTIHGYETAIDTENDRRIGLKMNIRGAPFDRSFYDLDENIHPGRLTNQT